MRMGMIGLGRMGANMSVRLMKAGHEIVAFDVTADSVKALAAQGAIAASSIEDMIAKLPAPRSIWMMIPTAYVDETIAKIAPHLSKGDTLIDGGNSYYKDDIRRAKELAKSGIDYVDVGTSGGVWGLDRGYCQMIGGPVASVKRLDPIFSALAPGKGTIPVTPARKNMPGTAEQGYLHCGPNGGGHFVKMVHNGIEYADMQLICETYALMKNLGMTPMEKSAVFRQWGEGELSSYLIDITADILAHEDPETGHALVEMILDTAEQKGTGKWTSQIALDLGVSAPTIADAVFARTMSSLQAERVVASQVLKGPKPQAAQNLDLVLPKIQKALLAAKICAYTQGFALLKAGDKEHDWQLPMDKVASVWRAGCIIRAHLLEHIRRAFANKQDLTNLLVDDHFVGVMAECQQDLREVVAMAAMSGVAVPALMSALSYYDAYRTERLPANLLQAQRDYFGAHSYQRLDKPGKFHTKWPKGAQS